MDKERFIKDNLEMKKELTHLIFVEGNFKLDQRTLRKIEFLIQKDSEALIEVIGEFDKNVSLFHKIKLLLKRIWYRTLTGTHLMAEPILFFIIPKQAFTKHKYLFSRFQLSRRLSIKSLHGGFPIRSLILDSSYLNKNSFNGFFLWSEFLLLLLSTFRLFVPIPYRTLSKNEKNFKEIKKIFQGKKIRESLNLLKNELLREYTSPLELAVSVFIGIYVGVSPFYGFQIILILFIATRFHLNRLAAFSAANISIPPVAPFLIIGSIQIGNYIQKGKFDSMDLDMAASKMAQSLWQQPLSVLYSWLIGSIILGILLGLLGAIITYIFTKAYKKRIKIKNGS